MVNTISPTKHFTTNTWNTGNKQVIGSQTLVNVWNFEKSAISSYSNLQQKSIKQFQKVEQPV